MHRLDTVRYCARTTKIENRSLLPLLTKCILVKTVQEMTESGQMIICHVRAAFNIQVLFVLSD